MSWSGVSFASWSTISLPTMAWHPAEVNMCAFVAQCPDDVHDIADQVVFSIFALNRLQARQWVKVDYNIVLYRIHVLIIVQCQGDGHSLSSNDGAVIWESFGQLMASRLTILKMAVDDCCCPHSLINLRSINVDFIMLSWSFVILVAFGPSLFSCYHAFTHSFNEAVSLRILFMCSRRKAWYLQGADHICTNLCRGQSFLYLETNGLVRGSSHATFSISKDIDLLWSGQIHLGQNVLGCQCRHEFSYSNSRTASIDVPPEGIVGVRVPTGDWTGAECSECQS